MQPARRQTHQSHAWRSLFKKQFHKTKLCRYYSLGQCRYAQDCPFAHSQSELTVAPDLTKTTMCEAWACGHCPIPAEQCQYAHGEAELRVTPAFGASVICKRKSKQELAAEAAEAQQQPAAVGLCGSPKDLPWHAEVGELGAAPPGQGEASKVPLNLGLLAAPGGPDWRPEADGAVPGARQAAAREAPPHTRGGKGRRRAQGKAAAAPEKSAAVVHLADHLREEAEPQRRQGAGSGRSSAMLPRTSGWLPSSSTPLWSPTAMAAAGQPMMATGPSVPTPSQIPVPQMFGLPEAAEAFAEADSEKLAELASRSLADARTATPASTSLSSASPLHWVLTPPSATSPERGAGLWDRTPSLSPARQRKSSPAYVDPVGTVTFHELPEEEHVQQEPPLSPAVRWARTPSTVASPSVSPPRRVEGAVRLTNRGPPTNVSDLHRLDNIFQRGPGLSLASAAPWGAQWPPAELPAQAAAAGLSSPWAGAAQEAFERILERLPQGAELAGEAATAAR